MKLQDIPIKIELSSESPSMLLPILHELASRLTALSSTGQSAMLDLRHEPLSLDDIAELRNLLGRGEVDANLNTLGKTNIKETSIAGIWWITHYNEQGNVTSEFIEITLCPEMLKTFPDELDAALAGLQDKVFEYTHRSTPDQVARRLNELGFGADKTTNIIN